MPIEARYCSLSAGMPASTRRAGLRRNESSTSGSLGFSLKRTMRPLSSVSMMPKPMALARSTGSVATVRSAPAPRWVAMMSRKSIR